MNSQRIDQRARILGAIQDAIFEHGYLNAKIGDIASRAGVSRATFYELFESKEDCFLAFQDQSNAALSDRVAGAVAAVRGQYAAKAAITALVELAKEEPHTFVCLTHEATIAGPSALSGREKLLDRLGELISRAQAGDARGRAPDIPPRVLLGAAVRATGMRIRRGDGELGQLRDELLVWSDLYETPIRAHSWSEVELAPPSSTAGAPRFPAAEVPRGRHRLPAAVVREAQRERILRGTAKAVSAKGYEHTTVADIVAAAGVSRDVFYDHMGSKRDALEQATKLFFERCVATFAGAFFTVSAPWNERVWVAGTALGDYLRAAAELARVALIDAYAPDAEAARQTDELLLGITTFIEGCAGASPDGPVPPLAVRAVLAALTEAILQLLAADRVDDLPGLLPFSTYMIVVPFVGAGAANDFVKGKLAARGATAPVRRDT